MGLLRDALDLGYITLDQYEELAEEWSELGSDVRHYGDVEALQKMVEEFMELGADELAEAAMEDWIDAISFYEELYEYKIFYSPLSKRWHDAETGQFVKDPYEWIRD